MKSLTSKAVVWFVALCVVLVFAPPLTEILFFFSPVLFWGLLAAGGLIFLVAAVRARRGFLKSLPAMLMVAVGLILYFNGGFRLGRLVYFQVRKGHYEELLAEATKAGDVPPGSGYHDEGPPPRFAFYWQRGVTDNWAGVVHDPTGEVMKVNEASGFDDLRSGGRRDIVTLFGGDLYRCERLQGDWYLCWFT